MRCIASVALAATLLCAAEAKAEPVAGFFQPTTGYKPLVIDGFALRWPVEKSRGALSLTWAFIDEAVDDPQAINCRAMDSVDVLRVPGGKTSLRLAMEAAARRWENAAALTIREAKAGSRADIVIGALRKPSGVAFANVSFEKQEKSREGFITRASICLNPAVPWKRGFDGNLFSYDLEHVLTHELGHAIGLDHPGATGQVMSYRYDEKTRTLQPGDIAGIIRLYGARSIAVRADESPANANPPGPAK